MTVTDANPFASTEAYYADHRPGYGDDVIEYIVERFALDDAARVLDLGCGAGQITVPLAAHTGEVVGIDPNEAMVREARERATAAGRENIEWIVGSDADLRPELGPLRLTTMGRSFHWMNQEATLDSLFATTEPGGGVALLGDDEWFTRGTRSWQDDVYTLADDYLDDLPERTGPIEYDDPWDELIAEFGFTDVETVAFESEREWTIDGIVGYVFSLSYCSPEIFGEEGEAFERDLRSRLRERDEETFIEDVRRTVISGRK